MQKFVNLFTRKPSPHKLQGSGTKFKIGNVSFIWNECFRHELKRIVKRSVFCLSIIPWWSINTCGLLDVNSCVNLSLCNIFYCTKWMHSHLLFCQLFVWTEKSNNGFCTHFLWLHGIKTSRNSACLINCRCEWTLRHATFWKKS